MFVPWCGGCQQKLGVNEFYTAQRWCKSCLKAASGAALRRRRLRAKDHVLAYLRSHPCVDCGEPDPVVLEFDHLRDKVRPVSALAHEGVRLAVLDAEILKCDVVCAMCHRRRTNARRRAGALTFSPRRAIRERNCAFVLGFLADAHCADCGLADTEVLEFDHRGPKKATVMALAWAETSLETIRDEIASCEIRCVNCHRRRTAREGGHYRYVASSTPP